VTVKKFSAYYGQWIDTFYSTVTYLSGKPKCGVVRLDMRDCTGREVIPL